MRSKVTVVVSPLPNTLATRQPLAVQDKDKVEIHPNDLHAQLSFAVFLLPPFGRHEPATLFYSRSRVQELAVAGTEPRLPVHALALAC